MRILLIEPAKAPVSFGGEDVYLFEPLALEYVAAGVGENHDVRILDLRIDRDLLGALERFQPDIVGITAYTVHVSTVRRLFEEIKAWNQRVLTVVGGHHATLMPDDFRTPDIDLIVRGEGVFAFREIVERFQHGHGFEGIVGVGPNDGDTPKSAHDLPAIDLDALPFPARKLTASYRQAYFSEYMRPLASIRTSKGCPYRCSFCALWKIAGGRYLRRQPERIVEELRQIEEECVFFADDESLVDAPRMQLLAQLIKESGVRKRYFLYGRSDTIARNPELLESWREVGLERVFVGLEFFRDTDLDFIHKGSTVEDNAEAVKILQRLGIDIYASFIVRPEFDREEFAALRSYCRELELDFASFAVLTPLPGTDFFEGVEAQLLTRDCAFFDFIHTVLPTTLPLQEFYEEFHRLYAQAIPMAKGISFLRRYPWHKIPSTLVKSHRVLGQLKNVYLDYQEHEVTDPASRIALRENSAR
jgi:radical SAM superfamily enzyme YgiQ (UPF0313 family)